MRLAKYLLWLAIATIIFVLDYQSKGWAVATLQNNPPVDILPFLRWVYVENSGAAFGFLANSGDIWRQVLLLTTIAIVIFLLYHLWQSHSTFYCLALSLLIGGAWGNLYDRVHLGYVVDFIDIYWQSYHWPAFNVADMAISTGVFGMVLHLLFLDNKPAPTAPESDPDDEGKDDTNQTPPWVEGTDSGK